MDYTFKKQEDIELRLKKIENVLAIHDGEYLAQLEKALNKMRKKNVPVKKKAFALWEIIRDFIIGGVFGNILKLFRRT